MSAADATAEVFLTAFKSLKRRQREAVLERMLADDELSEDLMDTLLLETRSAPFLPSNSKGIRYQGLKS